MRIYEKIWNAIIKIPDFHLYKVFRNIQKFYSFNSSLKQLSFLRSNPSYENNFHMYPNFDCFRRLLRKMYKFCEPNRSMK